MSKLLRTLVLALTLSPLGAMASPVDINSADAAALEQVKGIGPAKASAIVQFREANGPFTSVDELVKVPGIGEKSVQQMREQLTADKPRGQ
jgi:competence protein ComEA